MGKKYAAELFLVVFVCCSFLNGCAKMVDVEEWDYVMTLGIDEGCYTFACYSGEEIKADSVYAPTLKEAVNEYERTHPHTLQCGHIVAVVLGQDYLTPAICEKMNRYGRQYADKMQEVEVVTENMKISKECRNVIREVNERKEIPINTSVYTVGTSACEALGCDYGGKTLGEYLDGISKSQKKKKENKKWEPSALKEYFEAEQDPNHCINVKIVLLANFFRQN